MKQSTPELLQKLRQFVQDEAETQYRALEKQWSHSLRDLCWLLSSSAQICVVNQKL